jgi:hypothetical protein
MNKAFQEFKQLDAKEMEIFFLKAANYFFDNVEDLPNLPATFIGEHLYDCYKLMQKREGN